MTDKYYIDDKLVIKLHIEDYTPTQIASILFETTDNPLKLSREQFRRKIRTILERYRKSKDSDSLEKLESLKLDRPDVYDALIDECKDAGFSVDDVNYFWYKSENFSINFSSARKTNDELKSEFLNEIQSIKSDILITSESIDWNNIYATKNVINSDKLNDNPTGKLFVPSIFDLHIGKLAWGAETREDYSSEIAIRRFKTAIDDLISKTASYKPEQILFPIGNDLFNSDRSTPFPQTTNGTPQQDDVRWQKLFRLGKTLIIEAITKLSIIAPVHVVTVFSNHDHERVFYLGEVIDAVFDGNDRITVDNSPLTRKYYKWGRCLLGLAHGHNESPERLPLLMAQEEPKLWSDTVYREWLLGHLHHKKKYLTQQTRDYNGVMVTYLSSLSSADAWHYNKAYTGSIKGAEAFVYDKIEGLVGTAVHNIYNIDE